MEVYTRSDDPRFPQRAMDESSKQLLAEVQELTAPPPGQPDKYRGTGGERTTNTAREGTANS